MQMASIFLSFALFVYIHTSINQSPSRYFRHARMFFMTHPRSIDLQSVYFSLQTPCDAAVVVHFCIMLILRK